MPQSGVSVPRGDVYLGNRWSDDLELEVPARRTRSGSRATSRVSAPTVLAPAHDPYDLRLDLHVEFDLSPAADRAASRRKSPRAISAKLSEPPQAVAAASRPEPLRRATTASLSEPPRATAVVPERRTVTIHGRPDRYRTPAGARRRQPPHQRVGFQPDRVAMWAVLLGLVMLLVAATSSHAAVLSAHSLASLIAR